MGQYISHDTLYLWQPGAGPCLAFVTKSHDISGGRQD